MKATTSAGELATLVGGRLIGPGGLTLTGVAALGEASASDVSFLGNDRYRDQVATSSAGLVFVPAGFEGEPSEGRCWVVCSDPSAAFSQAVAMFAPPPVPFAAGRHASACVDADADVPASVHVGACAVIERGVTIGEDSVIAAGSYVGEYTRIGSDCLIHPNVTIRERALLGDRVIIHSGTVIGSDGFGYIPGAEGHTKIPQVGIVQIDDDVEIGACVAVDRARFGKTHIKRGAKVDNLVQIAHNVVIGEHSFILAQVGISGSTHVGRGAVLAGQVGVAGHLSIGDGAVIMAQSGVSKDVAAGARLFGTPAVDRKKFAKMQLALGQYSKLKAAIRDLERELAELRRDGDE